VRRHFLQRWSVILMLVSRLIFGELAHSTPHDMHMPADAAVASESALSVLPCAEHAGVEQGAAESQPVADSMSCAHTDANHDDAGCCDTVACKCPCAHVAALAMPSLTTHPMLIDHGRVPALVARVAQQRPFELFRPPA
jgi:hypothetical protein